MYLLCQRSLAIDGKLLNLDLVKYENVLLYFAEKAFVAEKSRVAQKILCISTALMFRLQQISYKFLIYPSFTQLLQNVRNVLFEVLVQKQDLLGLHE